MAKDTITKVNPVLIKDSDNGEVKYTLEFNRESVKWAENRGFKIGEVGDYLVNGVQSLFFYSFRMHHKGITRDMTDTILDDIGGASPALLERLAALYNLTLETLIGDNEGKNAKYAVEL